MVLLLYLGLLQKSKSKHSKTMHACRYPSIMCKMSDFVYVSVQKWNVFIFDMWSLESMMRGELFQKSQRGVSSFSFYSIFSPLIPQHNPTDSPCQVGGLRHHLPALSFILCHHTTQKQEWHMCYPPRHQKFKATASHSSSTAELRNLLVSSQ